MREQILHLLKRYGISDFQRCVLIVGAGLSSRGVLPDGSGLPTWPSLTKSMIDDLLMLGRVESDEHKSLTHLLEQQNAQSYLSIASLYKERTDPAEFDSFFRQHIDPSGLRPATIHEQIIRVGFRAIITTNFDRLFEKADPRLIAYSYPDCIGRGDILQSSETFLLKIHGSVVPSINLQSRLVISKGDYENLHSNPKYQEMLRVIIAGNPAIAVGYSCRDPDFIRVMSDLREVYSVGPFVYALLKEPDNETVKGLRDSNIKVLPYSEHAEIPEFFDSLPVKNSLSENGTSGNQKPAICQQNRAFIARGIPRSRPGSISSGSVGIDLALGTEGWPRGHIVEIFGPSGAGKTTLLMQALAEAQLAGGAGALIDADHATDPFVAERFGIDIDKLYFTRPRTLEDAWGTLDRLVSDNLVDVIALDSIAALLPHTRISDHELDGNETDTHHRNLIVEVLRKLISKISDQKATILITNHCVIEAGVMFGNPERQPWPTRPLAYYASLRIDVRRITTIKDKKGAVGYRSRLRVVKNRFAAPFLDAEFDVFFDGGISKEGDILDVGVSHGIITRKSAWLIYGDITLGNGRMRAINFLKKKPKLLEELRALILNPSIKR